MTRRIHPLLVPTLALAGVVGGSFPLAVQAAVTITLTPEEAPPKKPVRLGQKDKLKLRLAVTGGTNFSWFEAPDSTKALKLIESADESKPKTKKDGDLVGKASYRSFIFEVREGVSSAKPQGDQKVKMVLQKSLGGKPQGEPRATVVVPIEVKD